ncbi:unnamed protein product [Lota lota]
MTTAANWVANGASLEDCHSNIFSLAELTGIKWRCYSFRGGGEYGPVISAPAHDDPVLRSFMRCVRADLLCVWRRKVKPDAKELWIFWWGEQPDLADAIHHELEVSEEGLWECGLSYECRTLLFKAIHNLLERCLMEKDFVRIGKWFFKPYQLEERPGGNSEHLSCSFSFFLHGESNVCTSVEISQHQPAYHVTEEHIRLAQTSSSSVQVILSPYGLSGTLTGQAYKMSDPAVRKLMEEWSYFYPMVLRRTEEERGRGGGDLEKDREPGERPYDPTCHVAVEVIVGGVRMTYPAAFVLIAQSDLLVRSPPPAPGAPALHREPSHCSVPLTPPTSPEQPCSADSGFVTTVSSVTPQETAIGVTNLSPKHSGKSLTDHVVHQAWRECYLNQHQQKWSEGSELMPMEEVSNGVTTWDFNDLGARAPCSCYRSKQQAKPNAANPSAGANSVLSSCSSSSSGSSSSYLLSSAKHAKGSDKSDKGEKPSKRPAAATPFHHRLCVAADAILDQESSSGPPLGGLGSLEQQQQQQPCLDPLPPSGPGCRFPKILSDGRRANPRSLLHSPGSPLPPTLSPHPREQDPREQDPREQDPRDPLLGLPVDPLPPCPDGGVGGGVGGGSGSGGMMSSETALYAALLEPKDTRVGWWRGYRMPRSNKADPKPPDLPVDRLGEMKMETASDGLALKRLYVQTQKTFKISEERVKEHVQTFSLVRPGPGSEGPRESGEDPYDFKEDLDYTFSTSKRLRGQGRDPSRRAKGEDITTNSAHLDVNDAMSIFSSAPKSATVESGQDEGSAKTNPSLTREGDLAVNISDLDNIFDEDDEELGGTYPNQHSTIIPQSAEDRPPGKEGRVAVPYPSTVADLQRMFPTPPSLEQHPAFSPIMTYRDSTCLETPAPVVVGGDQGITHHHHHHHHHHYHHHHHPHPEYNMELEEDNVSPRHEDFKPPPGCSMFSPLTDLPSQRLPPLQLPELCSYRPSWALMPRTELYASAMLHHTPFLRDGYTNVPSVSTLTEQDYVQMSANAASVGTPATPRFSVPTPRTPRTPRGPNAAGSGQGSVRQDGGTEPGSPASSSAPSTGLPPGASVDPQARPGPSLPEAHSLYAVLLLSDSVLNLFKDRNFDSCCICACNMNVKGADVGVYIPDSTREDQYRCMCGFSAVVNRRLAHGTGLFLEDEMDIFGRGSEAGGAAERRLALCRRDPPMGDPGAKRPQDSAPAPPSVVALIREQCSHPVASPASLHRPPGCPCRGRRGALLLQSWTADRQWADGGDACAECYNALEQGLQYVDNPAGGAVDAAVVRNTALHPWTHADVVDMSVLSSQEVVRMLLSLQPFLQDAIQKKKSGRTWENIQHVQGPLTWQQFHKMAGRGSYGSEESPEPLPIPPLLLGYDRQRDVLALSPLALPLWDKLLLEPYGGPSDVAYLVLCPDSPLMLAGARAFFQELSAVYETCRLGKHRPLSRVSRTGIVRVGEEGERAGLEDQQPDQWFTGPWAGQHHNDNLSKLNLYASVCRQQLAPQLSALPLDSSLLLPPNQPPPTAATTQPPASSGQQPPGAPDGEQAPGAVSSGTTPAPSGNGSQTGEAMQGGPPPPPSSSSSSSSAPANTPAEPPELNSDSDSDSDSLFRSMSSVIPFCALCHTFSSRTPEQARIGIPTLGESVDSLTHPPAIVIYIVDPFLCSSGTGDGGGGGQEDEGEEMEPGGIWLLGLLRCYTEMLKLLPETIRPALVLQVVPCQNLLQPASGEGRLYLQQLRSLAFSCYAQCRRVLPQHTHVRSLTGFGPVATINSVLKSSEHPRPVQLYSPLFILGPPRPKQPEPGEVWAEVPPKYNVLFVGYCLSHDQRCILVSCTDQQGELLETCVINIDVPNRARQPKVSPRKVGLQKLWEWCVGLIQMSSMPWRLVIGRLGRLGHGELKDWSSLLGEHSLHSISRQLREACRMCGISAADSPSILSACLVAMEPQGSLVVMPDAVTMGSVFGRSTALNLQTSQLNTPQDASCTHILVFPTSATTQLAPSSYPTEDNTDDMFDLPFPDTDELENDIGHDMMLITGNLHPSPNSSPVPSPGSPSGMGIGSHFQHTRSQGDRLLSRDHPSEELKQQPLALGYYVSTAQAAGLPHWFWASYPQAQNQCPLFLKASLHHHISMAQSEELVSDKVKRISHPLDSKTTSDVLRFVLEQYNALSWLTCSPATQDRQSCLPVHLAVLTQMYNAILKML